MLLMLLRVTLYRFVVVRAGPIDRQAVKHRRRSSTSRGVSRRGRWRRRRRVVPGGQKSLRRLGGADHHGLVVTLQCRMSEETVARHLHHHLATVVPRLRSLVHSRQNDVTCTTTDRHHYSRSAELDTWRHHGHWAPPADGQLQ